MADSMQRSPTCPNCCRNFVTRDQGNSCYPLLLKCGHTFCEGCLIRLARLQKTTIACPTCQVNTPLPKAEQSVRSLWPDIYTLGLLVVNKRFSLENGGANFKPSQKTRNTVDNGDLASPPAVDKQKKNVSKCAECNTRNASCRCAKCECDLCGLCFDKVHKVSRTLMRHQASPLTPDGMTSGCQAHNNRIIEFYCEDDKSSICSHCVVMGDHKNHNIVSILDKNKEVAAEIEPALLVAKAALRRIKEADKVLTDAIPGLRTEVAQLTHELRTHFQMLHGVLQAREISLLEQIEEAGQAQVQPLEGMRNTLVEHAKMLDSLAKDAHRALKNTQTLLNATEIVDKLSSADDLPCCAVASEQKGPTIHCSLNKSLVDVISSYGTVENNSNPRYNLRRISEVPPEWVQQMPVQPTENQGLAELNGAESDSSVDRFGSQDSSHGGEDTSSKDSSPRQKRKQRVRTSWKPSRWELVFVTHIKHPCHFLVQRLSDNDRVDAMMKAINRFCNSQDPEHVSRDNIAVGDLCLAQYSFDHKWYRGRIRAMSGGTSDDSSDSGTDKKEPMVEVAYVDYGNSELVPIRRLRKMPQRFQTIPEMSMCCSLVDIVPIDKETGKWSQEAIQAFAKMVGDKPVLMKILNHSGSLLQVDLHKPPNEDIDTDMPVSLRDALVFLEVAYLRSPHSVPSFTASVLQPRRKFLPAEPLLQGQDIPVLGSHVMGPDLFYVQVISVAEAQYMRDMMTQMQELYNQEQGEDWSILCPHEGMVLVAKYEEDDLWYRAQVVDLPGNKQVDITYVDFGNSARVTCSQLKKIPDKFLKLPVQAVPCVLADVEPRDVSKGWSDEARLQFNQMALFKSLVVNVQGKTADSKLQVLLYDSLDKQTCINSLLAQEGHGTYTAQGSQPVPVPVPVAVREETVGAESVDIQVPEEPAGTDIQEVPLTHSSSVELEPTLPLEPQLPREDIPKAPETSPNGNDLDIDPCLAPPIQEGENCLPVTVCHVESPAQVFVQLASAGEDGLDRKILDFISLMSEMEEHYRDSEPSLISWKEQDICCVKYSVDNRWYRGRVSSSKGNNSFEIFHLDYGSREVVSVDNLRPLPEKFQYLPAFAICCHLANLVPAGGKDTWTATACEFLTSLVTGIPCTLVTKGPVEEGSLPVDLLYEHRVQETALTAAKASLISVSQSLIHEGVALKKKRTTISLKSESVTGPQPAENTATVDHNYNVKNISQEPVAAEADKIPVEEEEEVCEKWRFRKPCLPAKEQFPIAITFINSKAVIYGQEIKEDNSTLEDMMLTLQKQNEMGPELTNGSGCYKWKVGEPCQAQFTQDQHWYRARVQKVTEQGVEVQYVDFGNTEVLPAHSLRRLANLMAIPQQCLEMELFGVWPISPDGAWPTEAVLFLLENVMGQTCLAILKSKPSKGPLRVELVLGDGQNVGEMMVNRGLAAPGKKPCGQLMYPAGEEVTELLDSLKAVQRSPQRLAALKGVPAEERGYQTPSDDDSCSDEDDAAYCPPFTPAILPPPGQHFKINITHVDQPNQMYFQRVMSADDDKDNEDDPTLAETQHQLQMLETITDEIVAQVDTFHPLDNIIAVLCEGMACCACYTMDDSWYRAQVISVQSLDPLAVWVLYVDYGTSELLMADRLKQLPERYQTLPMQATKCTLLGVQPVELTGQESGLLPESNWTHQALKAMITAVDNKVLTACIKDPGPPPSLLLFESISPTPRLVVQSLVEQGLAVPDTTGLEGLEWVLDNMADSHSPGNKEISEEALEQELD
ncbi:RING finger protein 17-like isoform X3 [Branchiostoma floridae x Branchiostoma belcheri]